MWLNLGLNGLVEVLTLQLGSNQQKGGWGSSRLLFLASRQARAWGLPFYFVFREAREFFIFGGGGGVACATPLNKRGR
jgi:hypothetical protein